MKSQVKLFSGIATEDLANKIATAYGQPLGKLVHYRFSDGELQASYEESIRGHSSCKVRCHLPII